MNQKGSTIFYRSERYVQPCDFYLHSSLVLRGGLKRDRTNESGRTMLEMLGVLAIMGVIIYGAIAGITFGVDMYKVTATYNDLEELATGLTDLYSWDELPIYNDDGSCKTTLEMEVVDAVCRNDIAPFGQGGFSCTGGTCVNCNSIQLHDGSVSLDVGECANDRGCYLLFTVNATNAFISGRLYDHVYENIEPCSSNGNTLVFRVKD